MLVYIRVSKMKSTGHLVNRRILHTTACWILAVMLFAGPSTLGTSTAEKSKEDLEWQRINESSRKATEYLISQQRDDGAIVDNNRHHTTMTALAIMAMMSIGHKPADQTKEGAVLRKALEYVLRPDRIDEKGYFGGKDSSRMYGQGIITLMLAEVLGMGADDEQDHLIRERLKRAIELILRAQNVPKENKKEDGGWRYNPNATDTDLSVTAWELIALRAAKNAGIDVPKEAIDKAVAYIKRCYHKDNKDKTKGYFCYRPDENHMRFGSAAGGLLVLQICDQYDAPEVKGAADYFLDYKIPDLNGQEYFYYGMYYYAQGMFQRRGKYAEHAQKVVRELLLDIQKEDGSWPLGAKDKDSGKVYVTSMAMLSMSIHYHFLPIYQR